jgi:hypothetical protein
LCHSRWTPTRTVPGLTLVALACVCFARLITHPSALIVDGQRPSIDHANPGERRGIGNDATFFLLPHHLSIARVVREFGHVPLWDDRGFGGRPMAGNPQAGMFYPPVWLVWWLGSPAVLGWLTVAHLIWGGIGTYALMRFFRLERWPATVAAAVYEASPFLLAHAFEGHYPHVWAACWYPWAFWAYGEQRLGRLRGRLLLPLVLALTFLTGHPQEWFLLVLTLTAWSLWNAARAWRDRGPREAATTLAGWVAVLGLSIGIAAVDVAPELAVRPWLARDVRASVNPEVPRRYHLWQHNAWQLLSPTALGGPGDYFGDDNYWETLFSIGLVPLVLATVGAIKSPNRRLARGWLVLAGFAIWLACGRHLLLYELVFRIVPGMSWFRVPARSLFLANLAAAVLAGLGVETLERHLTGQREWRRLASRFAAVFAAVVAGLFLILLVRGSDGSSRTGAAVGRVLNNGCFWLTLGGITAVMLMACFTSRAGNRRRAVKWLSLLAMVELGWHGYSLLLVAAPEQFLGNDPIGSELVHLDRRANQSGRIRIKARDAFYGDLHAAVLGIEKTNITDVFQLGHAARLYETLYPVASFQRRRREDLMQSPVDDFNKEVRQAVFDRLSVRYLVSNRFEADPGWPIAARGACGKSSWVIQRNPSALPRAYAVPAAIVTHESARLTLPHFREVDPRDAVFMNVDPLNQIGDVPRQPFTAAKWTSLDPDNPVLTLSTEAPALLVITDTYMPGWTAQVDREPAPIFVGNLAQRVIPLPRPGHHTIALNYHAPGLRLGCIVSGLSLITWLGICSVAFIGKSRTRHASTRTAGSGPHRRATAAMADSSDCLADGRRAGILSEARNCGHRSAASISTTSTSPTSTPCPPPV